MKKKRKKNNERTLGKKFPAFSTTANYSDKFISRNTVQRYVFIGRNYVFKTQRFTINSKDMANAPRERDIVGRARTNIFVTTKAGSVDKTV